VGEDPLIILLYLGVAVYLGYLYYTDTRRAAAGNPNVQAMPGAVPCGLGALVIATVGALVLLALETGGELALGIADEQSDIAVIFLLAMLAAGIVEEVIFRGYLVVENKGRAAFLASVFVFSAVFALLHPHLWEYTKSEEAAWWAFWEGGFSLSFTTKAIFSTLFLFFGSLWFYASRFGPWNPSRSIIPCMLAHAVSNLGVFIVKAFQGHVSGWL